MQGPKPRRPEQVLAESTCMQSTCLHTVLWRAWVCSHKAAPFHMHAPVCGRLLST